MTNSHPKYSDDYQFVQLLLSGDADAWDRFYKEIRKKISKYLNKKYPDVFNEVMLEEICDGVHNRLTKSNYKVLREYRGDCSFSLFVTRATDWEVKDWLRKYSDKLLLEPIDPNSTYKLAEHSYFYDLLISPIVDKMDNINHVIIVPHFFWHYLPFHALYDPISKEYLIDKFSISYAPSETALNLCLRKNVKSAASTSPPLWQRGARGDFQNNLFSYKSALILANPSNDLPFSEEEAEKVKARFNSNAYLFKGKDASFNKLSDYSESNIIHLACHGYFKSDEPLFSHIVLHGENSEKSCFFLPDLFNLKLKTSLVMLSACETGLSQFNSGDELIGISRAFFMQGLLLFLQACGQLTINQRLY